MSTLIEINISEQKYFNNLVFPLVLTPSEDVKTIDDALRYLKNNKNMKFILNKTLEHGTILFRGFPVNTPNDFNDFTLAFGWNEMVGIGGAAVRNHILGAVYTSNESPPDQPIRFHHEMAIVPKYPSHLFFYCDTPASDGG